VKHKIKGILITASGASMWGFGAVAGKFVMQSRGVDPVWMVTLRLICAGLIFLTIGYIKGKGEGLFDIWRDKKYIPRLLVVAIFAFAVCQTTYFAAVDLSNAGIASAIQQTAPVFVLLWMLLKEKRRPKKMEVLVVAIVICGAFVLSTGGNLGSLLVPASALILALISAVTCAMYTILPVKLIQKFGTFYTSGWGMLLAGIMLVPVAKLWKVSGTWDVGTILAFSTVVILGTVVAFGMFLYGVTLVKPFVGSVLGLVEPVLATIVSAVVLKQVFRLTDIVGIALILTGVLTLSFYQSKH
jgi:drug/metabolite transporter (DMT)-like permease